MFTDTLKTFKQSSRMQTFRQLQKKPSPCIPYIIYYIISINFQNYETSGQAASARQRPRWLKQDLESSNMLPMPHQSQNFYSKNEKMMEKPLVFTLLLEFLPEQLPDAQWLCRPFALIYQHETLPAFFSAGASRQRTTKILVHAVLNFDVASEVWNTRSEVWNLETPLKSFIGRICLKNETFSQGSVSVIRYCHAGQLNTSLQPVGVNIID